MPNTRQAEVGGWNTIVRPYLTYRALTRSADGTTITMVVPPFVGYDVLAPETLSVRLLASVLLSGQEVRHRDALHCLLSPTSPPPLPLPFPDSHNHPSTDSLYELNYFNI